MFINNIHYSFDDEIADSFCYTSSKKEIKIQFDRYYEDGNLIDSPCKLLISKWQSGGSKGHDQQQYKPLEHHLGVFSMILSIEMLADTLKICVNTIDDRYIDLIFNHVSVYVEKV